MNVDNAAVDGRPIWLLDCIERASIVRCINIYYYKASYYLSHLWLIDKLPRVEINNWYITIIIDAAAETDEENVYSACATAQTEIRRIV